MGTQFVRTMTTIVAFYHPLFRSPLSFLCYLTRGKKEKLYRDIRAKSASSKQIPPTGGISIHIESTNAPPKSNLFLPKLSQSALSEFDSPPCGKSLLFCAPPPSPPDISTLAFFHQRGGGKLYLPSPGFPFRRRKKKNHPLFFLALYVYYRGSQKDTESDNGQLFNLSNYKIWCDLNYFNWSNGVCGSSRR